LRLDISLGLISFGGSNSAAPLSFGGETVFLGFFGSVLLLNI